MLLLVTLRANEALAAAHAEHADLCIFAVAKNFYFDRCAINKWSAENHIATVFYEHVHVTEGELLVFFSILKWNRERIAHVDLLLETCDFDDSKHG